ncbi:hypothetical protein BH24ACT26_BH24ACT26_09120 [soil metagenome]
MSPMVSSSKASPVADYRAILLSRKWWVIVTVIVVVGTALYGTLSEEAIYNSESTVLVQEPAPTQLGFAPEPDINLETETQLVSSPQVAEIAAENLGLDEEVSSGELLAGLTAEASAGAARNEPPEILIIGYLHPDPGTAQERASAFADAYFQFRYDQLLESKRASAEAIEAQISDIEADLTEAQQSLGNDDTITTDALAEARVDSLATQLSLLRQQLAQLTPPTREQVGYVIQPAYLPSTPINRDFKRNAALGLFVGVTLGIGIALIRERLDDHLGGRDDLESSSGTTVLGVVPRKKRLGRKNPTGLVVLSEPNSPMAEAYRALTLAVAPAASKRGIKSLLITSPSPQEGKTTTTANLGVTLAQTGKGVILVSADLQRLRLEQFFNLPPGGMGITDLLAGNLAVEEALARPLGLERARLLQNVRILPSGPLPENPAELLSSASVGDLLVELEKHADLILVDAPPILAVSHALALSQFVDGVLLIADAKKTSRAAVKEASRRLEQIGANLIGAVLNNDDAIATTYGRVEGYASQDGHRTKRAEPIDRRTG